MKQSITLFITLISVLSINAQITDTGTNVGIGTTAPSERLEVRGNLKINTDGTHSSVQIGPESNDRILSDDRDDNYYGGGMWFRVHDETLSSKYRDVMMLADNGNVGIGTRNPAQKLDVGGNLKINTGGTHSSVQIGPESNDRILSDDRDDNYYGGGMWFRVHDETLSSKYRDVMMLADNGNVGIGTKNPAQKLDVGGNLKINTGGAHTLVQIGPESNDSIISDNRDDDYYGGGIWFRVHDETLSSKYRDVMMLAENGNVGIGTRDTQGFKLGVNGKIAATEVKVALYNNWADFVFCDDYELPTLNEVENHIQEKGHLKDIPSAAEVAENGIMLGDMNAKLLLKIEELTLYTIAQEKKLKESALENNFQNSQIEKLISRLEKLEKK